MTRHCPSSCSRPSARNAAAAVRRNGSARLSAQTAAAAMPRCIWSTGSTIPTGDVRLMWSMTSFARCTGSISASAESRCGSSPGTARRATIADTSCLVVSSSGPQWARIPIGARRSSALRSSPPAAMSLVISAKRGSAEAPDQTLVIVSRLNDARTASWAGSPSWSASRRRAMLSLGRPCSMAISPALCSLSARWPGSAVSAAARSSAANATSWPPRDAARSAVPMRASATVSSGSAAAAA